MLLKLKNQNLSFLAKQLDDEVGQMLGALLGAGQGTFASEVKVDGGKVQVTRELTVVYKLLNLHFLQSSRRLASERATLCSIA